MHLDLDGQGPLHAQLTRALKEAILSRRVSAGTRVPATRELARELDLSRNTVLAAYEQLAAEGFLQGRVGSGSYVADVRPATPASPLPATAPTRPRLSAYARRATALSPQRPPGARLKPRRYNLEYGVPIVTPALHTAWRRALLQAANDTEFDYPPAHGMPQLRREIARYLGVRRGLAVDPEDVLVVGGTQQAIDLVARVVLDPGDTAVVEEPCYQGLRQSLVAIGARIATVPCDDDGLIVDALPTRGVRLVCATPSHQFPSGDVMSLPRRLALLAWAGRQRAFVLEDDYDGEFRHDGRPLAALKSLDGQGRVVYIGSFSKVMFPALRLGYMVVPPALRDAFRAVKWLADRGSGAIEQVALAKLIASGQFERLLRRTGKLLAERRRALLSGLAKHCDGFVEPHGASAGMHVLVALTKHRAKAVPAILAAADAAEVGVFPADPYYARPPRRGGLLLGYSGLSARDITEATRRLGEVLRRVPPNG